jgi:hypothetical protein
MPHQKILKSLIIRVNKYTGLTLYCSNNIFDILSA